MFSLSVAVPGAHPGLPSLYSATSHLILWYWGAFLHQAVLRHQLQLNPTLPLFTRGEQPIPQVKGLVPRDYPQRPPPPLQMSTASPHYYLCFWPTNYRLEIPMTLGSVTLLKWLTELRVKFYLLDHQFIIKGCNSGTARCKRCAEQVMWEGMWSFHAPSRGAIRFTSPQPGSSLNPNLLGVTEALSHMHDWLTHWPLVIELSLQLLPPPWRCLWGGVGAGLRVSNL